MFKPAKMQFSCTCLQYQIDFESVPAILEQAKELGFATEDNPSEKGYLLRRAIEATLGGEGDDWILKYSSEEDDYRVPRDFERALDCLRLSFIAGDHAARTVMLFGEPAHELQLGCDFSLQGGREHKPWLFASITDKCNLKCSFCYNKKGGKKMTPEVFGRLIEQFRAKYEHDKYVKEIGVTIGGGEPTVHPELEKILETARKKADAVTLTTNGTNTERLLNNAELLDGVAVSAPFVYSDELKDLYARSKDEIGESVSEIASKIGKVCVASIVTNEMRPEDVFKVEEFAEEAGATNTLFLLYKPVKDEDLMPTKGQARQILEKVLELAYRKENTAIDCCYAAYTTPMSCGQFYYAKPDGKLKRSFKSCPFPKGKLCRSISQS